MVTTRRQRAGSVEPVSQQPAPSASDSPARSTRSGGGRARSKLGADAVTRAPGLEAIDEDTAHHESPVGLAAGGTHEGPSTSAQPQRGDEHEEDNYRQGPPADEEASTSGSSDDEDEPDIFGPSIMGQLAGSLRAALQAKAGTRERSASPGPGIGSSKPEGKDGDIRIVRWQPEVQLPKQTAPQRQAPGSLGDKEKGLAKKLVVPPRAAPVGKGKPPGGGPPPRKWYELPATQITDEVKQELRLLRLRGAYDPKRFYKSFDETKFPKHFQIGTVLDNPTDFYSSRLSQKERGASITQELMRDPSVTHARKKRYAKLQAEATKYQKVKKRKTDDPRVNQKKQRPKH